MTGAFTAYHTAIGSRQFGISDGFRLVDGSAQPRSVSTQ